MLMPLFGAVAVPIPACLIRSGILFDERHQARRGQPLVGMQCSVDMEVAGPAAYPQQVERLAEHTCADAVPCNKRVFVHQLADILLDIIRTIFAAYRHYRP